MHHGYFDCSTPRPLRRLHTGTVGQRRGSDARGSEGPVRRGVADFDWRLSVADVSSSGAFSKLPGVDRVITLTDGPGLLLTVDGQDHTLEPFRPLPFAGEAATECEVVEPTRDFNVMTRRGVCTATVNVCTGSETLAAPGDSIVYVISLKGEAEVQLPSGAVNLDQFDAVLLPAAGTLRVKEDGRATVVRIDALSRGIAG